ncbi:hypothetical protein Poli38472_006376 [Pythium oligandrum]|uniref:Uncharacterized protein n=1 Tax=Pythium oligandrum TaxID=41045 RepID=A0A8K1C4N0_PYTOL|nr:hypothetical protein Poli38472_006376 [Pythium oligandrum]|eukprot:TMW56366.1 hypothetical protein Poli38472_006376 [Pythium oligandrum]
MDKTPPSSQSSQTADAASVDYTLLQRLRQLVRYEYANSEAPSDDELLAALLQCHNHLHDAYHLLKRRRVAAQEAADLAATDFDVDVNMQVGNGAKRSFHEVDGSEALSQDGGHKRPARSLGLSTDFGRDATLVPYAMTQGTQFSQSSQLTQMSQSSANRVDLTADETQARQVLTNIVDDLVHNRPLRDAQWVPTVFTALCLTVDDDLQQAVEAVTRAVAKALEYTSEMDQLNLKRQSVDAIMEVLLRLPHDGESYLPDDVEPTDEELDRLGLHGETVYQEATAASGTMHSRSEAAKTAIEALRTTCESCIRRFEWFSTAGRKARASRNQQREQLQQLVSRVDEQLRQSKLDVEASEHHMNDALKGSVERTMALQGIVDRRRDTYVESGAIPVVALFKANVEIIQSTDPEVVSLLNAWNDSNHVVESAKRDVIGANARLEFQQKLRVLLEKTSQRREWWLQSTSERLNEARRASEARVTQQLRGCVPRLTHALRLYYDFHSLRQRKAQSDRAAQEEALRAHQEFYEDLVPTQRDDIIKRISEYNGVILRSTQLMREAATAQSNLWAGKRDVLPREVLDLVLREYQQLWQSLDGGGKEMMRDCVSQIQGPSHGDAQDVVAIKTEPVSPVISSSATPQNRSSPTIVDLTGDQPAPEPPIRSSPPKNQHIESPYRVGDSLAVVPAAPHPSELPLVTHEYPVGAILYTKMAVRDRGPRFFRGQVDALLPDGTYKMVYEDGEVFVVARPYIFTEEQMREEMLAEGGDDDDGDNNRCAIM